MGGRAFQLLFLAAAVGVAVVRLAAADGGEVCSPVERGVEVCTHGNDAPPPGVDTTDLPTTAELWLAHNGEAPTADTTDLQPSVAATSSVACLGTGSDGARVQVVYAHAGDVPSRLAAVAPLLRQYAADADDAINASAGQRGSGRRVRFVTNDDCTVAIRSVTLSPAGDDTFGAMRTELRAQGLNAAHRKYLVFMDAAVGICGIGEVYPDERPGASDNYNNAATPMYARVDTACWQHATTHELLHTLGSVQQGAPNSTPAGHCTDENDVMCYVDAAGVTMSATCPDALPAQVDCNHNDYFNPAPAAGTYLASHWNTANSRFLQPDVTPPPPVQAQLTVPSSGHAGKARPVSVALEIPDTRTVVVTWSITRSGCRFANPTARRTTMSCPVTTAGEGQVTLTVRDSTGQTAQFARVVSFTQPRSPRATVLQLHPSSDRVAAGRSLTLTGVLADPADGGRIYGMPVIVYELRAGSSRWRVVARPRTDVAGRIRVTLHPRRNTTYMAHSSATPSWNWDASPRRAVRVAR